MRTSLVVQWFRLHASNAGDMGLILSWGTRIPHAVWLGQKKIKKQTKKNFQKKNLKTNQKKN